MSTTNRTGGSDGFTAEERAPMEQRAEDRALAERVHELVTTALSTPR